MCDCWNRWTEFNETWPEARSQCPLPSLCVLADRKNKMAARPLAEAFSTSPLKPSETAEWNSTKLDRKQDLNVLCLVCVFLANRENKMAALPLIGWDIFDFSSETAERNSTKLDRKQDLKVLYHVWVFRAGPPGLWLAETFWTHPLKPLNGIQCYLAGSKISMSLTKFVIFGPIGKIR